MEKQVYEAPDRYEIPAIVYEGSLEIQAGSPLSVISDFDEFEF
jgi:hypothetical protein